MVLLLTAMMVRSRVLAAALLGDTLQGASRGPSSFLMQAAGATALRFFHVSRPAASSNDNGRNSGKKPKKAAGKVPQPPARGATDSLKLDVKSIHALVDGFMKTEGAFGSSGGRGESPRKGKHHSRGQNTATATASSPSVNESFYQMQQTYTSRLEDERRAEEALESLDSNRQQDATQGGRTGGQGQQAQEADELDFTAPYDRQIGGFDPMNQRRTGIPPPQQFDHPHDGLGTRIINSPPEGDLSFESLKVVTMEDLSRVDIRKHAMAIREKMRQYSTPLPDQVVSIETRNYYTIGETPTHIPAARKATLRVKVAKLGLTAAEKEKLELLCGVRYNKGSDTLKLVGSRFPTREMNTLYVKDLLTVIVDEAKKKEHQNPDLL